MLGMHRASAKDLSARKFARHAPDIPLSPRRLRVPASEAQVAQSKSLSGRPATSEHPSWMFHAMLSYTNNKHKQPMQLKFANLTYVAFCAVLALGGISTASAEDKAPSATGNWTWTVPGRNGGAERKMSLTLTQAGEKLTGKLSSPGRDGAARETEIADGSVKGADVTFSVTREFNGTKMTSKYSGKVSADAITGKVESKDRDGNDQSRDWTAKREAK